MKAIIRNGVPEEVFRSFTDNKGVSHPANVLTLWSEGELAAIDVYPVTDGPVPEGYVVTGSKLKWNGTTVTRVFTSEPAPPPPIPETVSRFQARASLLQIGKLGDVEAVVAQADAITQLAWAETIEWKRSSPALNALVEAVGLTQSEVDDLFRAAAQIEV